jgi:predicted peptidase
MTTRREVLGLFGSISLGHLLWPRNATTRQSDSTPPLAAGAPHSPERLALIEAFRKNAEGIDLAFEARTYKSDLVMPYRLFQPKATGPLPLVVYLHGSGGLGDDNQKQMGLGNVFGTRVWALPENQTRFPCYVVAPQTDRGWVRYGDPSPGDSVARVVPGLGDGARLALEVIETLMREFPIDPRRIYLTGQSMGGAGAWHLLTGRPTFFAGAAICCGSRSVDAVEGIRTPLWNFHGDADNTVPVEVSRDRISAIRKAGARPLATEYAGVGHNVWEWVYTEPSLISWIFSLRRA